METRADREAIAGEIRAIDARLARGVRLLLDGAVPTEQLRAALDEDEKRKAALTAQQATLEARARLSEADAERIEEEVMRHADNARALLKEQVAQARQMIWRLVEGRLAVTPLHEGKGVTFTGTGNYGGLLSGKTLIATNRGGPNGTCHLVGQFLRFPLAGIAFRT